MDHISEFDIRLEKEAYYAGESIHGHVILHTTENFKLRCEYISLILLYRLLLNLNQYFELFDLDNINSPFIVIDYKL